MKFTDIHKMTWKSDGRSTGSDSKFSSSEKAFHVPAAKDTITEVK